jgi:hypothetical protein
MRRLFYLKRDKEPAKEPAPPLPETSAEAMKVVVNAPLFNPTDDDHYTAIAYRADAIARALEQRLERGDDQHDDHHQMVAEAMEHGWRLVRYGKWAIVHLQSLADRLGVK